MSIIELLIYLTVIGFALYLVTTLVPMNGTIKQILIAVVVLLTVLWLLETFGLFSSHIGVPRVHRITDR
jgi:hypothetical protein